MRVAVTGAGGRLGSNVVRLLRDSHFAAVVLAWDIPDHDLDDPASAERLVSAGHPDLVVHCAAWTDVDGCAREPEKAMRRNGTAVGEMAKACVEGGAGMIMISTNEVFDGRRMDHKPYSPADQPNPANPYGAAKLAGERLARAAFGVSGIGFATAAMVKTSHGSSGWNRAEGDGGGQGAAAAAAPEPAGPRAELAIVRPAWLFGLPGSDFPQKLLAAARRALAEGHDLSLVSDETGNPTYAPDLAAAVVSLVAEAARPSRRGFGGIHHVVNGGLASRADWGRRVVGLTGVKVPIREVPLSTWPRPSQPPPWGVLEPTPLPIPPLRHWRLALEDYVTELISEDVKR